jgi:hypothetical protein
MRRANASSASPQPIGVICYKASRLEDQDYQVNLELSEPRLTQLLELSRSRLLNRIDLEIAVPQPVHEISIDSPLAPGMNRSSDRSQYFVWKTDDDLLVQSARFYFALAETASGNPAKPLEDHLVSSRIDKFFAKANRTLARVILNYPQARWAGDGYHFDHTVGRELPTAEDIEKASKTGASGQIRALMEATYAQGGLRYAHISAGCAVEFLRVTGTIFRARQNYMLGTKPAPSSPPIFPSHVPLWVTPAITISVEPAGWNCLEGLDRADLVGVCAQFFETKIRCSWFEKMMVEALVGAEAYATVKASKMQPSLWSGTMQFGRTLLATWAYSRSKGGAMYAVYMTAGNFALGVIGLAFYGWLVWQAYLKYEANADLETIGALVVLGLFGAGWAGRWLTRLVVRWSRPPGPAAAGMELLSTPFGAALGALLTAYQAVSAEMISTTAAAEAIRSAMLKGAAIDPVALAFLERAASCGEFVWGTSSMQGYARLDGEEE